MINQIKPEIASQNVFAPFKTRNDASFAIMKPFTQTKQEEKITKEKKSNALGYSIATTALIAGFGVFALMKGLPKGWYKKLDKLFKDLEEKTTKLAENKQSSRTQTFKLSMLKQVKALANKTKSLFNAAPLKDILVSKGMQKVPVLNKFSVWITDVFEKISVKTSRKSYANTMAKFDNMFAKYNEINTKIPKEKLSQNITIDNETKTAEKWLEIKMASIQKNYNEGFNGTARAKRLTEVKKDFANLDQKVWDATYGNITGFVRNKKTYETFISEELAAPTKIKLSKNVNNLRKEITNDIEDNYIATKRILNNIDTFIDPADKSSRKLMKDLRENLVEYRKLSGENEAARRTTLTAEMTNKLNELNSNIKKSDVYEGKAIENVSEYLGDLEKLLLNNKKGDLQEILTIYKQLLPEKEYIKLKNDTYKAIKSFDKSIDYETDKLFDKLRDLKIGSAPTDVLSILTSLLVIGWGLTKAENKEERTSVSLKYGIPAIGAIATSLYCTVRLVSGGASLVVGLLSGGIISKIGIVADDSIKKYDKEPLTLADVEKSLLPSITSQNDKPV